MTRWSANTKARRSCSALAYGLRSTATAAATSTGSSTTSGTLLADTTSAGRGASGHDPNSTSSCFEQDSGVADRIEATGAPGRHGPAFGLGTIPISPNTVIRWPAVCTMLSLGQ
jgi:hypothetical protein